MNTTDRLDQCTAEGPHKVRCGMSRNHDCKHHKAMLLSGVSMTWDYVNPAKIEIDGYRAPELFDAVVLGKLTKLEPQVPADIAEKLVRYRCAALASPHVRADPVHRTDTICGVACASVVPPTDADIAARVESFAHAMLAAERQPVVHDKPTEAQIESWAETMRLDVGEIRRLLNLAGVLKS